MIDELELVRASMATIPDPTPDVLAHLRAELDELMGNEEPALQPKTPLRLLRGRRARFGVAALGTVAASIVILLALPSSSGGPSPAAAALRRLARVARSQPATVPPGPGQFEYTESIDASEDCVVGATSSTTAGDSESSSAVAPSEYCALIPEHRQVWIGSDNSGRMIETEGQPEFVSSSERTAWIAGGRRPFGAISTHDVVFGPHTMADGPPDFASLPTDPSVLGPEISARKVEGGPPGAAEDFTQIGDLLRETDASPALRAALYQVAAALAGVESLGSVADHNGRVGIGFAYTSHGLRNELIFDPKTAALLGEQSVAAVDNPPGLRVSSGMVISWDVYLSSGIVNSLSDTLTGTVAPAPPVSCVAIDPHKLSRGLKPAPGSSVLPFTCARTK